MLLIDSASRGRTWKAARGPGLKKPYYGWVVLAVTFLITITESGVFQNILSVFLKPMVEDFGWSRASVTLAITLGSIAGGVSSPFIGPALDRRGPRVIAFLSITLLSLGLIGLAFMEHLWQLYLFFGLGRMVAVGALSLVTNVTVAKWFVRYRGRAMGINWLGGRVGSALLPPLLILVMGLYGWRQAWAALGVFVFVASALPSLVFLRRAPEEIGLNPDGDEDAAPLTQEEAAAHAHAQWSMPEAVRTPAFWILNLLNSVFLFVGAGIAFHLYPYLTDQGMSGRAAVMVLTTMSVFSAFASMAWGFMAERVNVRTLLLFGFGLSPVLFALLAATAGTPWAYPLAAAQGFVLGGQIPLLMVAWPVYFGRDSIGAIQGLAHPFRLVANAFGPIFAAVCFDQLGSYVLPFVVFFFLLIACLPLIGLLKPPVRPDAWQPPS